MQNFPSKIAQKREKPAPGIIANFSRFRYPPHNPLKGWREHPGYLLLGWVGGQGGWDKQLSAVREEHKHGEYGELSQNIQRTKSVSYLHALNTQTYLHLNKRLAGRLWQGRVPGGSPVLKRSLDDAYDDRMANKNQRHTTKGFGA